VFFGQIGDRHQRAICCRLGLRAIQVAGVHTQKNNLPCLGQRREVQKHLAQSLGIDPPIFQGFVQAGPGPLKKRRERQFGKAARACFAGQRIHQVEQSVFRLPKAAVHSVTKFVQCAKVHRSNAPDFGLFLDTLLHLSNPLRKNC
jgi:hypothetical protein